MLLSLSQCFKKNVSQLIKLQFKFVMLCVFINCLNNSHRKKNILKMFYLLVSYMVVFNKKKVAFE